MIQLKYFLPITLFLFFFINSHAQRVKRKGVQPIDVTKNKGQKTGESGSFTLKQFEGKWQEINRTLSNGSLIEIKDTIMLNFSGEGKVSTREGNQMTIIGSAEIDQPGNILLVAADVYTILSVSEKQLKLLDEQESTIHTFDKTAQFAFENLGNLSVQQEEFIHPVLFKPKDILGKWMVYRKQANPGAINASTNIIQYLTIGPKTNDDNVSGEITFYKSNNTEALPCKIKINNTSIEIAAGSNKWILNIYKASENELVFGDAAVLLYYAKPL